MLRFPCASAIKLGVVLYSHARNNHTPRSVLKGFFKLFVLRSYPYSIGVFKTSELERRRSQSHYNRARPTLLRKKWPISFP